MDSTNTSEQGLDNTTWEHRSVCVALETHISLASGEIPLQLQQIKAYMHFVYAGMSVWCIPSDWVRIPSAGTDL